jgi:hypothetical protein
MIEPMEYRLNSHQIYSDELEASPEQAQASAAQERARLIGMSPVTTAWNPDINHGGFSFEVSRFNRVRPDHLPHAEGLHPVLQVIQDMGAAGLASSGFVGSSVYNDRIIMYGAARYGSPRLILTHDRNNKGLYNAKVMRLSKNASDYDVGSHLKSMCPADLANIIDGMQALYMKHPVLPIRTYLSSTPSPAVPDVVLRGTTIDVHAFAYATNKAANKPILAPIPALAVAIDAAMVILDVNEHWPSHVQATKDMLTERKPLSLVPPSAGAGSAGDKSGRPRLR